MSKLITILAGSGVPATVFTFVGGGFLDGSFSRDIRVSTDSSSSSSDSNREYISFFKDSSGGGSESSSGLFIKTSLKSETFGGVGPVLKGALGIKLSNGSNSEQSNGENKPWVMIGSAENGMFYIPGWRVTDWAGTHKKIKKHQKNWAGWFKETNFTKNEDNVGPDVWCDTAFEKYKGFLSGPLKIVIHKNKPIFLGNDRKGVQIFANKNNGDSVINFGGTGCNYSQGFAFFYEQAVIVGNWESGTKDATKTVGRTFKGIQGWQNAQGVNLGELKGLIMDRIDRFSINSEGIMDSRGHFINWNSKYNPTIKIS